MQELKNTLGGSRRIRIGERLIIDFFVTPSNVLFNFYAIFHSIVRYVPFNVDHRIYFAEVPNALLEYNYYLRGRAINYSLGLASFLFESFRKEKPRGSGSGLFVCVG